MDATVGVRRAAVNGAMRGALPLAATGAQKLSCGWDPYFSEKPLE